MKFVIIALLLFNCNIVFANPIQYKLHETEYIVSEDETLNSITDKFISDNVPFNVYKEGIISDNYFLLNTGNRVIREVEPGDKLIIHYWVAEEEND